MHELLESLNRLQRALEDADRAASKINLGAIHLPGLQHTLSTIQATLPMWGRMIVVGKSELMDAHSSALWGQPVHVEDD